MTNPAFEAFKAAALATPHTGLGQVSWTGSEKHHDVSLMTERGGRRTVMDFTRWGTQRAQPRFQVYQGNPSDPANALGGVMHPAAELLGIHERGAFRLIHPDAAFIAEAYTNARAVVAYVEVLRSLLAETSGRCGDFCPQACDLHARIERVL